MKAIDNSGLQTISKIIVESIGTDSIYCFGERKQVQIIHNPFQESASVEKEHTHFYLLVLIDEYVINAVADISDSIKNKTGGRYTVTLLMYKTKSIRSLTPHQFYFYNEVFTKGHKIFGDENFSPTISFDEIPKLKISYMRSYWENRYKVAETFLAGENQIDYSDTGFIQESMLHIAVEQICLGLINVFLGYHPDHFSMAYLFDICEIFTTLTSDAFPRSTTEDKRLFDLLKAHPNVLRWGTPKKSSLLDTEHLERRCGLFFDKACEIVKEELERIEKLEAKNGNHGNK